LTSETSFVRDVALIDRIRCEFLEMPGLCLTPPQAARLLSLDYETSQQILPELPRSPERDLAAQPQLRYHRVTQ